MLEDRVPLLVAASGNAHFLRLLINRIAVIGDSIRALDFIAENLPKGTPVSLMRQYTPEPWCTVPGLGRRVTDAGTLQVVTAVYAGLINKTIVATLQKYGCNAIGLSGADGNAITSRKRPATPVDYGFVGDIDKVNGGAFDALLAAGFTPVVCAINHDGRGTLLNTNADTIASGIAVAMSKLYDTQLIMCFEKNGVLLDKDDETSVIPAIDKPLFEQLKAEGKVNAGMLPKLKNAFYAIDAGVSKVVIKNSAKLADDSGTTIR